jgi:hypothetical protein
MSRWAKVIIQENSTYALHVPGKPEIEGRSFIWDVELEKFDDFNELISTVQQAVWSTKMPYKSADSDEKELVIRYIMRAERLNTNDSLIRTVGDVCRKAYAALIN